MRALAPRMRALAYACACACALADLRALMNGRVNVQARGNNRSEKNPEDFLDAPPMSDYV